jgi:hypothetical protein
MAWQFGICEAQLKSSTKYPTRQEALRATFADSIVGETICVHRNRPDVDHEDIFSCPCEPIFIEI